MIVLYIIVFPFAFLIFAGSPLPLQIVFLIANMLIKDPIPVIDEAFMAASIFRKVISVTNILSFVQEHFVLSVVIFLGIVIAFIVLV